LVEHKSGKGLEKDWHQHPQIQGISGAHEGGR